ncbi:MAG: acyl-ACP--UDP-N-acetylglucosamine O-acyltransferase [Gemmataceae bacterium]|nr:acyl-ACP--UDP-N-acetylglucosamine O-acyltransferase [Gemmataceae bacterium]MCI0741578.1 acyl-ACP--UDP-N-acetylglucosamine O-acyltransferase [Gemmataceae bacterium]
MARIHPTAIVSSEAELADSVEVGAYAVVEGKVQIGRDCVIRTGAYLFGPLVLGPGNVVHTGAVLGDKPQHLKYKNEATTVEIGAANIFREGVTVHRGTTHSWKTVIGDHNFFMANSHAGHDCIVGSHCVFANGALLGGHCVIGDSVIISGNAGVHQFCRVGRLAFLGGCSATTKDMPPFVMQQLVDNVVGLNLVGMRRSGMPAAEINAVRQAFRILFREGLTLPNALVKMEQEFGQVGGVREMIEFLRGTQRGINPMRQRYEEAA